MTFCLTRFFFYFLADIQIRNKGEKMAGKMTKNKSGFKREAWFTRQVAERTVLSLKKKNEDFARENDTATDEELINYVIRCARDCRKSPTVSEVIGGKYIARRFGSWNTVLYRAGLPRCSRAPNLENRRIYKREFKIQADLFREERQRQKMEKEAAVKMRRAEKLNKKFSEEHAESFTEHSRSE